MPAVRNELRFRLNDETVALSELPATQTLLDFLRIDKGLTGSKEGCAEGDCGACTVLVGQLSGPELVYETVTSCIRFTGSLDGCHVVTVEALSRRGEALHPVQQAMVDCHGSQCGFCTPGIVMALYGLYLQEERPSVGQIETALQGNLCRCTGYAPIVRAGLAMADYGSADSDALVAGGSAVREDLLRLGDGARVEIGEGRDRIFVPANVDDLAAILEAEPGATIVAGATDVGLWVTKMIRPVGPMVFIGNLAELHRISETEDAITLGAGTTYTEAWGVVERRLPELACLWNRIGGEQVRNMGTVGGNIANGSPIGDTPPPLIALGATITLRKGGARRQVALEDYFIAYGKQDRAPGEFVESVTIPVLPEGELFAVYKISKRREEDISALCGAFRVRVGNGSVVSARIAFGGMAATPKRARAVEQALAGRPWNEATIEGAIAAFAADFRPLTDMRASREYRLMAAQNLLRRFYLESTGETASLRRGAA
jgi:xanthine dehydrogenase small subunit